MPVGDPAERVADRNRLERERVAALFEPRQIQQVADDRLELVRLLLDDAEVALPCGGIEPDLGHAERFDVAAYRRQRRHQLVREVRRELAPDAVRLGRRERAALEILRHPVERPRQRADFVAPPGRSLEHRSVRRRAPVRSDRAPAIACARGEK